MSEKRYNLREHPRPTESGVSYRNTTEENREGRDIFIDDTNNQIVNVITEINPEMEASTTLTATSDSGSHVCPEGNATEQLSDASSVATTSPAGREIVTTPNEQPTIHDLFRIMMEKLDANKQDLSAEFKQELNAKLDAQNARLDAKLDAQNARLDAKLDENQTESKLDMQKLKLELSTEMVQNNNDLKTSLSKEWDEKITKIDQQMGRLGLQQERMQGEIADLKTQQACAQVTLQTKILEEIEASETTIRKNMTEEFENQNRQLINLMAQEDQKVRRDMSKEVETAKEEWNDRFNAMKDSYDQHTKECDAGKQEQIKEMIIPHLNEAKATALEQQNHLSSLKAEIEIIKEKASTTPISVICTGGVGYPYESQLPKFTGRAHNPRNYLERLHRYYEKSLKRPHMKNADPEEHLRDLLENSLEGHAARWFQMTKEDIWNWESFVENFERKYWSRDVQRGVRQRLDVEKYKENGRLNRSEYFTERVIILRSLNPPMEEDEIVASVAEHFSELIQDARRVQNVNTVQEFEALLQREDLKDSHRKSQANQLRSPPRPTRPQYQSERRSDQRPPGPIPSLLRDRFGSRNQVYPNQQEHRRGDRYHNRAQESRYQPRVRSGSNHYGSQQRRMNDFGRPPQPAPSGENRRYPTLEQGQVCHTVASTSSSQTPSPPVTENAPTLNP